MPPIGPRRKNDGPACRVCGCTEHNACTMLAVIVEGKKKDRAREVTVGCSWVPVSAVEAPLWLCSACEGTAADLAEALKRASKALTGAINATREETRDSRSKVGRAIINAALRRYSKRLGFPP